MGKEGSILYCNLCNREYIKDRKKGHKGEICNSCATKTRVNKIKILMSDIIGSKCVRCGYDNCKNAIEYHHVKDKIYELSRLKRNGSTDNIIKESLKCIPLCSNCHREFHMNMFEYKDLNTSFLKDYQKLLILSDGGNLADATQR